MRFKFSKKGIQKYLTSGWYGKDPLKFMHGVSHIILEMEWPEALSTAHCNSTGCGKPGATLALPMSTPGSPVTTFRYYRKCMTHLSDLVDDPKPLWDHLLEAAGHEAYSQRFNKPGVKAAIKQEWGRLLNPSPVWVPPPPKEPTHTHYMPCPGGAGVLTVDEHLAQLHREIGASYATLTQRGERDSNYYSQPWPE